ncbi:MAG: TRAP transporter small permease subunit [Ectothiorhodospiraceae bacterium]|nr:TRAP transporter small permease subunit [Ectothiorhodospiraceae bacterium]
MQKFLFFIDHISTWVAKVFAWAILILTFVVTYEVFMRYVMRSPTAWAYDTAYILYGSLFMMAGAYALSRNAHVRADVVSRHLPVRVQAGVDLVLYFVFFFPGVLALIYSGYFFAAMSWAIGERSPFSPGGPPLYHFKSVIPICGAFLALQGIAEVTRCILCIKNGYWPARLDDVKEVVPVQKADEIEEIRT